MPDARQGRRTGSGEEKQHWVTPNDLSVLRGGFRQFGLISCGPDACAAALVFIEFVLSCNRDGNPISCLSWEALGSGEIGISSSDLSPK